MGDFVKEPGNILTGIAGAAAFALGGPLAALAVVGTGTAVGLQKTATDAQKVELELAKRKETEKFRDREIQRKRRIKAILGSQAAEAAARGIQLTGSVANISITDAKRAGEETFIDDVNTRASISALSRRQRTLSSISRARTATSIMGLGERMAKGGAFDRKVTLDDDGGGGNRGIG